MAPQQVSVTKHEEKVKKESYVSSRYAKFCRNLQRDRFNIRNLFWFHNEQNDICIIF